MLHLPEITHAALDTISLPANEPALREMFFSSPEEFNRTVPNDDNGLTVLKLYLHWLPEMKARYDALGIPQDIYENNLTDITLWCDDFTTKNSLPGIAQWRWAGKSLRLELFRLGRLQFEPIALEEAVVLNGRSFSAGTPALNVHIPAGEPLDPEACLASFHQSENFFPRYLGKAYPLFICSSWLMAPALKEVLPPSSRILQFQSMFETLSTQPNRQAEERVFGFLAEDPTTYPENTSLQQALKSYLLSGKQAMSACAVRPWNSQ